ncbi:MAG TPA: hydantoinase B/oxoprolinase family protein, partial [Thermoplasmata archaeon]|nr:hydantoinase B/oxoprolinase family protein [Thermoplasmata archaeon]
MKIEDVISIRIIKNALDNISKEMFWTAIRTAKSSILYETFDFAPALTDANGHVISIGLGVPGFLGIMPFIAKNMMKDIEEYELDVKPGDIFFCDDPYKVGTHINDVAEMMPVFYKGKIVAISEIKAHINDVGGMNPGSWGPNATEIYQEGTIIPTAHVYREGKLNREIMNAITQNSRIPEYAKGDVEALAAALRHASKRVKELCDKYGVNLVLEAMDDRLKDGRTLAKKHLKMLPKEKFHSETKIMKYKGMKKDITLTADIEITDDKFIVDLTNNPEQVKAPINTSFPGTYCSAATAFVAITDPHIPVNEGYLDPIEVIVPRGSILNATPPAPVGTYWETMIYVTDLIWKALASKKPDKLTAGHFLSVVAETIGMTDPRDGRYKILCEPNPGGWGAGIDKDGETCLVSAGDGETYCHPVEVIEREYPIRVERMQLNLEDGVGNGKFRGGFGMRKDYRMLTTESTFTTSINRIKYPPWGLNGGENGSCNHMVIIRNGEEIWDGGRKLNMPLLKEDIVSIRSGGGGGWGNPLERDPELVLKDYKNGLITADLAKAEYRVSIDEKKLAIDENATKN